MRMAMIAITTSNSMRVKPLIRERGVVWALSVSVTAVVS
jgi:hypothetical protein